MGRHRSWRPRSGAGFDGRDLVGRDLVACSRFWARDRVATAVVRGASPFFATAVVRATNRHGRDHPANLPLSLGVVGRSRRVAEAPECHWFSTSRRSWPLGKGPLSSSRRECQIKIPERLPFGAIMSAKCICHFCLVPRLPSSKANLCSSIELLLGGRFPRPAPCLSFSMHEGYASRQTAPFVGCALQMPNGSPDHTASSLWLRPRSVSPAIQVQRGILTTF